jgi:hypothetical protein
MAGMDTMRLRETLAYTGAIRAQGEHRPTMLDRLLATFTPQASSLAPLPLGEALDHFVFTLPRNTKRSDSEVRSFLLSATAQILDPIHMPLVLAHVGVLAQWLELHPAKLAMQDLPVVCHLKSGGFVVVMSCSPGHVRVRTAQGDKRLSRPDFTAQVECKILKSAAV